MARICDYFHIFAPKIFRVRTPTSTAMPTSASTSDTVMPKVTEKVEEKEEMSAKEAHGANGSADDGNDSAAGIALAASDPFGTDNEGEVCWTDAGHQSMDEPPVKAKRSDDGPFETVPENDEFECIPDEADETVEFECIPDEAGESNSSDIFGCGLGCSPILGSWGNQWVDTKRQTWFPTF